MTSSLESLSTADQSGFEAESLSLFPTDIHILRWHTEPGFNERLSEASMAFFEHKIKGRLLYAEYNLWHEEVLEFQSLKAMFIKGFTSYIETFFKPAAKKNHDFDMRASVRIEHKMQPLRPHAHHTTLIGTYYCQVDIAACKEKTVNQGNGTAFEGDLVLKDPRPGLPSVHSKNSDIFTISPEVGMMVIVPGSLLHWAIPVSSGDARVCIANNMNLVRKSPLEVRGSFDN